MESTKAETPLDEAQAHRRSRPALDRLTGNATEFLDDFWRNDCHLFPAFSGHQPLLDLFDFDALITQYGLRGPMVWVMGGGEAREAAQLNTTADGTAMVEGMVRTEDVATALAAGNTVSLRGLNHFWPPVGAISRQLELDVMHPVLSNAYLTPAGTRGLALHHDAHDVFVIQTHGEKVWEVFRPRDPNPMAPWNPESDEPGELAGEFVLTPGDCLYIPLGFPHRAHTRSQPSLHVTLGVDVKRWVDAFDVLCTLAAAVPVFREPLPADFPLDPAAFRDRLLRRLQLLSVWASDESLTGPLLDRLWARRRPPLDGHIASMVSLPDHAWEISRSDGDVVLGLWDVQLALPDRLAPALARLSGASHITVRDIDPGLEPDERLSLVRRLVAAGIVRVQGDGAGPDERGDGGQRP